MIRINFLDGIRGGSAVFVVFFHALLFTQHKIIFSDNLILRSLQKFVSVGHISVAIFIVLSGFCLAIPVVKNNLELKGGFDRYIKRRFKRIIPPYYFALGFSIILYFIFPILRVESNTAWDSKIPLSIDSILSHLLLIHNLSPNWVYKINGAHWSIATEWQIYFLYPIMLLLWKRFNVFFSLLVFLILSLVLYKVVPSAAPQYIILFFFGVIAAYISFKNKAIIFLNRWLFIGCIISFIPIVYMVFCGFPNAFGYEVMFGMNFSLFLILIVKKELEGKQTLFSSFFSSKILKFFGKISYSLYLIHGPILALLNLFLLENYNYSYDMQLILMWGLGVPISLVFGYCFYSIIEKRYLNE